MDPITAIIGGATGLAKLGMSLAGSGKRAREQQAALSEMNKYKSEYMALDTSNPYANLQNTMEDLTVNQQQAQFQAQQGAQQRANIMQGMQGAAGGSGVAALAQAMANQGQLATQKASASIGQQEAANQRAAATQAARLQRMEAEGEARSQDLQYQKTATLLGMSQQRVGAANQARAEAKAQQMSAVGDIASAGLSAFKPKVGGESSFVEENKDFTKSLDKIEYNRELFNNDSTPDFMKLTIPRNK